MKKRPLKEWQINLLTKVNEVWKHRKSISKASEEIVSKIKTVLERGGEPKWKLHKEFTAVRVRLVDKLGENRREILGKEGSRILCR